jgi:uncharacterized RDD family membrane protein YckC
MACPQCGDDEISSSGKCPVCGYQTEASESQTNTGSADEHNPAPIELHHTQEIDTSPKTEELPRWRQELSERLQALKQKKEDPGIKAEPAAQASPAPEPPPQGQPNEPPAVPRRDIRAEKAARKPAPRGQVRQLIPQQKTLDSLNPGIFAAKTEPKIQDPEEVQRLIDDAVSRQSAPTPENQNFRPARPAPAPEIPARREGKLILLSRTLAGLIDLILAVLCTGVFIIAVDYFSGILVLDSKSMIDYAALFLFTYLLYSIFFLSAANQTIGMMIADLRVIGYDRTRPLLHQLIARCFGHLISLFALGIGLFYSLFDAESQCFHDRFSRTRIIRL